MVALENIFDFLPAGGGIVAGNIEFPLPTGWQRSRHTHPQAAFAAQAAAHSPHLLTDASPIYIRPPDAKPMEALG